MRLKFTLPRLTGESRQLLAFVFGSHRPEPVGEPSAHCRPFVPPQHGQHRRPPGDMRQRPCTTAPTNHRVETRRVPALPLGRIVPRGPRPATVSGLTPVAHTAPPDDRLARQLSEDLAETTMAMPAVTDLDLLVYGTFEDRLVLVDTSLARLLTAAHDTALRTTQAGLQWLDEASRRFDRMADELFPPQPPRVPQFDDICAPFATGRRRAPGADRPTVAGLFPALPAAPARHALPGGAK